MPQQSQRVQHVFRALGDPIRLAVVERLVRGEASTSEMAKPFRMALPSFIQHLAVLEDSGLVSSRKRGRQRIYRLETRKLEFASHWLDRQRSLWTKRLDQLDAFLLSTKDEKS